MVAVLFGAGIANASKAENVNKVASNILNVFGTASRNGSFIPHEDLTSQVILESITSILNKVNFKKDLDTSLDITGAGKHLSRWRPGISFEYPKTSIGVGVLVGIAVCYAGKRLIWDGGKWVYAKVKGKQKDSEDAI